MRLRTRVALAVLGGLVLIVVVAALLVPRLVNLNSVRATIVAQLSQRLGAAVTIGAMRLYLVPLPHVRLTDVHVAAPDTADVTIPRVAVHPRLMTLLSGHPQLESVRVDHPVIKIQLSSGASTASDPATATFPASITAALAAASAAGAAIGPETLLEVHDGQVEVDGKDVDLSSHDIDLHLRVGASESTAIDLEVHGSVPEIVVRDGDQSVDVRGMTFDAQVSVAGSAIRATLTSLEVESPRAQVSGRFTLDETPPRLELDVVGKDVDVASVRAAALSFAPDADLVESIFDVLRGGTARTITVHGEGDSSAELGDSIALRGTLSGGTIHIAAIGLDLQNVSGNATVVDNVLAGEHASATVGNSRATEGSLRIGLSDDKPELQVQAMLHADAADLPPVLDRIVGGALAADLKRLSNVSGTLAGKLTIGGTTSDVTVLAEASRVAISGQYQGWPTALQVSGGPITLDPAGLKGSALQISSGQTQLGATSLAIGWGGTPSLAATFGPSRLILGELYPAVRNAGGSRAEKGTRDIVEGTVAADTLSVAGPLASPDAWKVEMAGAVRGFRVDSPQLGEWVALTQALTLNSVRLKHDPGKPSSFSAMLAGQGPLQGKLDVAWAPHELNIKHLELHDRESNATLSFLKQPNTWSTTFSGRLVEATVAAFLPESVLSAKAISGQFGTTIPLDQPMASTIWGHVEIEELGFPLTDTVRWTLERLSVDGDTKPAKVSAVVRTNADGLVDVTGTVASARDAIVVNLDASGKRFDVASLAALARERRADDEKKGDKKANDDRYPPIRGTVRVNLGELVYDRFVWKPFRATVTLAPTGTKAAITTANICGIATPAAITVSDGHVDLTVKPAARGGSLDASVGCLFDKWGLATGQYTLSASVTGRGQTTEVARALNGPVTFAATKGQVQNLPILAKVFSVISITTGSVQNILGIGDKALPYDQLSIKAALANGTLRLTESVLTGPTVKIVGEGSIDLIGETVDLTLLVAPLVAADNLIGKIPVIRGIGNLVSIPVHVNGPIGDPAASLLPESGVSGTLVGVMKKTVTFPLRAIEGLFR